MSRPLPTGVVLRPRRPDDLSALGALLAAQQAETEYPLRWPLPMGVARFLQREGELAAWVAEVDGDVAGHVAVGATDHEDDLTAAVRDAVGHDDTALVTVLFVGRGSTGRGVGGALLDAATDWIRAQGLTPVLDVVPTHARAIDLYTARGWREVGRLRPAWLAEHRPDLLLMALD